MKSVLLLPACLLFLFCKSQNTGIGTTTPQAPLHIKTTSSEVLRIEGSTPYISLYDATQGYRGYLWYDGASIQLGSASGSNLPVTIAPNLSLSTTFLPNGNVGINNPAPLEKLDVGGNIKATGNIKGSSFTFISPKTYYYSLSGSDIFGKISSDDVEREIMNGGGAFEAGGSYGLTAAVHLPHGSTITKMTVYFYDNSSTVNLQVELRQNSSISQMALITSSGIPGESSMFDNTINNATIDNSLYAYTLDIDAIGGAWPNLNLIVRRIIFEYTMPGL